MSKTKGSAPTFDLLRTLHRKGSLAPGDPVMSERLWVAGELVRERYTAATKDPLRAYDLAMSCSGPARQRQIPAMTGRKFGGDDAEDAARALAVFTAEMLPEIRDTLFAVVVKDERLEDIGARLSTYTNPKTCSAIATTFLRIGLRQVVEAGFA